MWAEITYPFLNFNGCTIAVYEWISNPPPPPPHTHTHTHTHTLYNGCNYLSMLGLKLIHVSKRGHCCSTHEKLRLYPSVHLHDNVSMCLDHGSVVRRIECICTHKVPNQTLQIEWHCTRNLGRFTQFAKNSSLQVIQECIIKWWE